MDIIEIDNVSKTFKVKDKTVEAVRNVSLHVAQGSIYGIIGFSGAGKSTLVRCINMLEKPTSGKITVNGAELTSLSEKELRKERKKIGMIFQHFDLMPSRTAADNIALALHDSGLGRAQIKEKVDKLLSYVELSDRASSYPSQLSGGQKQRVAIARALANDPQVLLCDEATSALDPRTTRSILDLLRKLNRELGITIVVITHEMNVIKRICDRVAVMENGEVVEEGDVFGVFASPVKPITKDFISTTSNLSEIRRLAEENDEITRIGSDEVLVMMKFTGAVTSEPLISYVSREYDIVCNILFADLEIISGLSLGGTVGIFRGESRNIDDALAYLTEHDVNVEVIKDGRTG